MIILRSKDLGIKLVTELGVDHIRKASVQKIHHHKKIQLTFMESGELLWKFRGGTAIHLRGGEFCLTQPGDVFTVGGGALAPCHLLWIHFTPFASDAWEGGLLSKSELAEMGGVLSKAGNPVKKASPPMLFYFTELMSLAHGFERRRACVADRARLRLFLAGIFTECAAMLAEGGEPPQRSALGERVRAFVLRQPARALGVEEIAGHFRLSPGLFGKKFKKETGICLADFARRVKLEEAIRRLTAENGSVTEIAYDLGFSSSQYFATVLKRYSGRTPRQFRETPMLLKRSTSDVQLKHT